MSRSTVHRAILWGMLPAVVCLNLPVGAGERPAPEINPSGVWIESPWGKPVIDRGAPGDWDHATVDNPYVFTERGRYYCFYEGQDKPYDRTWHERSGLAVSQDGRTWVKHSENPILDIGPPGSWDAVVAKLPVGVIKYAGRYYLFYSGRDNPDMKQSDKQLGLATADRPTGPWTKWPGNPVLRSRPDQWDRRVSTHPAPVFEIGGKFFVVSRSISPGRSGQRAPASWTISPGLTPPTNRSVPRQTWLQIAALPGPKSGAPRFGLGNTVRSRQHGELRPCQSLGRCP